MRTPEGIERPAEQRLNEALDALGVPPWNRDDPDVQALALDRVAEVEREQAVPAQ